MRNSCKDREALAIIESAVSMMAMVTPIYGIVFMYLNKIEDTSIKTMAVGATRRVDLALYYNPEFVKSLTSTQLRGVLKHESLHILLHHIARNQYFNYNMKGYNIAADMAINCHITDLPPGCFYPKTFHLPDNESSEFYYEKLKEEVEKKGGGEKGEQGVYGAGELADDHSKWGDCEDEIIKEKVRGIADKAIKEQEKKGWGDTPGGLVQQILAANKPVVNWKKEVRYFINQIIMMGRRSTRMRPNRRYGYTNPGTKRNYLSQILVGVDTSGSVSDQELQYFLQEINGMISHVKVDLVQFDHELKGEPEPFEKKQSSIKIMGRGGTSFDPVIQLADERGYDGLIIFTDGYCSIPPKPKCRVMWCVCKQNEASFQSIPYGKKVTIEHKKN